MPGYPYGYSYGPAGQNNKMAIASLVTSAASVVLAGLCGIGLISGPVGAVLGVIALNQIKDTGEDGRGLAIAGIVLGALLGLIGAAFLVLLVIGLAASSSSPTY
jgi:hypothetical protein